MFYLCSKLASLPDTSCSLCPTPSLASLGWIQMKIAGKCKHEILNCLSSGTNVVNLLRL